MTQAPCTRIGLLGAHRQEQRVALADELLRTRLVEDDPRVGQRAGREGHPAGTLALIRPVTTSTLGPLGREHQVDAGGPGQLGDPDDRVLDVARGDHHQVGQLVDDHQQVRVGRDDPLAAGQRLDRAGPHATVEVVDVLEPEGGEVVVPDLHLPDHPLQRLGGLLGAGDDRGDQVRDALVDRSARPASGSTRTMRTSSGVERIRIETIIELMKLDLPAPVAPATSRWGILARLATT